MKDFLINRFLDSYLKKRPLFYSFLRPQEALFYQKYLPFKKPILDFGCGDGFFAGVAFGEGKEKIDMGLDVNPKVLIEAQNSGIYKRVAVYDDQKIPFSDQHFSTIVANCVLEHLPHLEKTLREINRVLKKGGVVYLTVVTDQWQKNLLGGKFLGKPYCSWFKNIQRHFNLLTRKEWKETLESAGFCVKEIIPYFTAKEQGWCEIFHYLSFPSLIFKKVLGRWAIFNNWPLSFILGLFLKRNKQINKKTDSQSCLFFSLGKD